MGAGKWWTGYGNGPDNSRYFASRQINKENVNQLQVAWTYPHGDTSGNPIVVRGVIYGRGRNGSIVAVDAKSGKELWVRENMNGMSSRGMMYWESRDGRDQRLIHGLVADAVHQAVEPTPFGVDGRRQPGRGVSRHAVGDPGDLLREVVAVAVGPVADRGELAGAPHEAALDGAVVGALADLDRQSVEGDDAFMAGPWPVEAQHAYSLEIIRRFGFDESFARLDLTVHPFAASSGTQDIRLTTRYKEDDITSIHTAMHECGHGLYEHGVSQSLERTPLCHGVSSALHESQSRMWENIVGRSRPFWNHFYPQLQAAFPGPLGDVEQERFYRAINRVKPSYIRVDADEATYNLHIILRFELEQEIFAGTLDLKDLPEVWNARFDRRPDLAVLWIRRLTRFATLAHRENDVGMRAVLVPHSAIPDAQKGHVEGDPDAVVDRLADLLRVLDDWTS